MIRYVRLCLLAAAFACAPAFANFHLWQSSELYSSADGKVQFLELRALLGGQQFLSGHGISATGSAGTHTFTFDHDLGGDTAGHTMLIGTVSFASLGIVAPDYIVPDNFFSLGSGAISFGPGADDWTYSGLPTNNDSLNRNGTTGTNSPRNFAGVTGTVPASTPAVTPFNVQALWWNDPDFSEGGWGINLTQQGSSLFMSWFTYDAAGGMWLFMDNAVRAPTEPNVYTGAIYRATGAPFSNYNATSFKPTQVGNGIFRFTDAGHGSFQYTVNGATQTKQIKRFNFGTVPTCDQSGAAASNFTDLWWRAGGTEAGWGVNLSHQGDIIFASWFTYATDGKGMWLYASRLDRTNGNTFTGELVRNTGPDFMSVPWNNTAVHATVIGSATIAFTDASNGTFSYTVDGVSQVKPLSRFAFGSPVTTCR